MLFRSSMIGALVGLAIVVPAAKAGFLLPKTSWDFAPASEWPVEWMGKIEMKIEDVAGRTPISVPMAWAPYLLLAIFLVMSRIFPDLKAALMSVSFGWRDILGETGVSGTLEPLYLPGGILCMVVLVTFFLHRMKAAQLGAAIAESSKTLLGAGFVLIFTIPMVRILINSGVNGSDLVSMPVAIDRKSTRLNSSHMSESRMPSSA